MGTTTKTWKVTYFEPQFGQRSFVVTSEAELEADKAWLEAGGFSWKVREIRTGGAA